MSTTLFTRTPIREMLGSILERALDDVSNVQTRRLANEVERAEAIDEIVAKHHLQPLALEWDAIKRSEPFETTVLRGTQYESRRVDVVAFDFTVPFRGDRRLLECRPSEWLSVTVEAQETSKLALVLRYGGQTIEPERINEERRRDRDLIDRNVATLLRDVTGWNGELEGKVQSAVLGRASKLAQASELGKLLDD